MWHKIVKVKENDENFSQQDIVAMYNNLYEDK